MDKDRVSLKQFIKAHSRACLCFTAVTAVLAVCGLAGDAKLAAAPAGAVEAEAGGIEGGFTADMKKPGDEWKDAGEREGTADLSEETPPIAEQAGAAGLPEETSPAAGKEGAAGLPEGGSTAYTDEKTAAEAANEITIQLSAEEKALLDQLCQPLKERDLQAAAAVINQNETQFKELFFDTFDASPCLYDGTKVTTKIEGHGLVFKKASTVFYGDFLDGKPSGKMLVLQAIQLNAPRYDYADGVWKDGHMDGFGTVGYDYYEGIDGEEAKETIKQGYFSEDLMEGDIVYINTDSEGNAASWHFSVADGRLKMDERWSYDEEKKVFSLLSDDDEYHAFVVDEGSLGDVQWRNMITWEENE